MHDQMDLQYRIVWKFCFFIFSDFWNAVCLRSEEDRWAAGCTSGSGALCKEAEQFQEKSDAGQ